MENLVVMLLRAAVRLNQARFADPRAAYEASPDFPGWRRDQGGGDFEWWVLPSFWRAIYEPDIEAVEAAQAMQRVGLLRRQDDGNLTIVAKVGGKTTRVYAIDGKARAEWRVTAGGFGRYGMPRTELIEGPTKSVFLSPDLQASPANLAAKLEVGVNLALDEMMRVLGMKLDPTGREFGAVLRAKSAIINAALNAQVRVDEIRLRARQADLLPEILRIVAEEREKLKGYLS
jgi:hypothetical protein